MRENVLTDRLSSYCIGQSVDNPNKYFLFKRNDEGHLFAFSENTILIAYVTHTVYRGCQNSPYRLWGLVVETKTINFSIGTRVRKRTVFPLHAKSPHTLFLAPLTGIACIASVELRHTITSCPHIPQTCSIPWITATQDYYCTVVSPKISTTSDTNVSGRITNSTE